MKTINYYLNLDYEIIIRKITKEDGGGYFAYYKDFKGVMGDGENADAAIEDVKSAFKCYLEVALEHDGKINEPSHLMKSKRINITVPIYALEQIDTYAKSLNMNRSTFLVESALKQVSL
jgi:predicted RNase H-like HicB family nuclease